MMETKSQLVLLFLHVLDRLVLLFQRFVRRKNVRGVELQSETVLPARKDLSILFSPGSTDVFGTDLSSAVFARWTRFFVQSPVATNGFEFGAC